MEEINFRIQGYFQEPSNFQYIFLPYFNWSLQQLALETYYDYPLLLAL